MVRGRCVMLVDYVRFFFLFVPSLFVLFGWSCLCFFFLSFSLFSSFSLIPLLSDTRPLLAFYGFFYLDYAKLVRKKDKNAANGETVAIDMDTLRASARAAEVADKSARASKPQQQQRSSHQSDSTASPGDVKPLPPQQYHQTTFQLASMITTANPTPNPSSSTGAGASAPSQQQQQQQQDQNQNQGTPSSSASSITPGAGENGSGKQGQQQQQQHNTSMPPPTSLPPQPPWVTPVIPSSRPIYPAPDHLQHQSFMRGSHGGPSR